MLLRSPVVTGIVTQLTIAGSGNGCGRSCSCASGRDACRSADHDDGGDGRCVVVVTAGTIKPLLLSRDQFLPRCVNDELEKPNSTSFTGSFTLLPCSIIQSISKIFTWGIGLSCLRSSKTSIATLLASANANTQQTGNSIRLTDWLIGTDNRRGEYEKGTENDPITGTTTQPSATISVKP